ncbi:hypothetical protein [Nonomuraea sp. NPDC049480]|uniref:hypothetical protein n=1 Tax=Nonomuraea sp. NPDC049480 TaxID=3364353 RepID=UPI0037AB8394
MTRAWRDARHTGMAGIARTTATRPGRSPATQACGHGFGSWTSTTMPEASHVDRTSRRWVVSSPSKRR